MLWFAMGWAFWYYWQPVNSYTSWTMPVTHWHMGGVFVLDFGAVLLGIVLMFAYQAVRPAYFRGEVLNRDTPTRVPQDLGTPVGLFGIEPRERRAERRIGSSAVAPPADWSGHAGDTREPCVPLEPWGRPHPAAPDELEAP